MSGLSSRRGWLRIGLRTRFPPRIAALLAVLVAVSAWPSAAAASSSGLPAESPYAAGSTTNFTDISSSPFGEHIVWIADRGITKGCEEDRFCPTAAVSREEMASLLVRALGLPKATQDYYVDDERSSHEDAINRLAAAGIASACAADRYCPGAVVTRAQMAAFLSRGFALPPVAHRYFYDTIGWTLEVSINRLAGAGIASGCGSGRYCPQGVVTREQVAAFLHRALDRAVRLAPPPAIPDSTGNAYGALGADTLWNAQVGGDDCRCANAAVSFRFRAFHTGSLKSIRIYIKGVGNSGYAAGTGGTMSATVVRDDGSGKPSSGVVGRTSFRPPAGTVAGVSVSFADPPELQAGELYHMVFRNTDASPTTNYASLNSIAYASASVVPPQRHPALSNLDWAQLANHGNGWFVRPEFMPIMALTYGSGATQGVGTIESWIDAPRAISGARAVRERFTVRGGDRTVAEVSIRVRRISGSGPLRLRLESGSEVLAESSIAASQISTSRFVPWVSAPMGAVLRSGSTYNLVITSSGDTQYETFVLRDGSLYGYPASTYFTDGVAQYTTGAGWTGFVPSWGGTNASSQADLQLFFR